MLWKKIAALAGLCLMLGTTAGALRADAGKSVENAYSVCSVFDRTGLLSEPCSVSGWHSAIDVKMDTSGTEARKICDGVVRMIHQKGIRFAKGWKIRIYSPFSGKSTLAQCSL